MNKISLRPFPSCLSSTVSLELAPDLCGVCMCVWVGWGVGGGLWVIARALPAPAVIWFVAEGSQLQPSHHFVQDGYCLQGERGRGTREEEGEKGGGKLEKVHDKWMERVKSERERSARGRWQRVRRKGRDGAGGRNKMWLHKSKLCSSNLGCLTSNFYSFMKIKSVFRTLCTKHTTTAGPLLQKAGLNTLIHDNVALTKVSTEKWEHRDLSKSLEG